MQWRLTKDTFSSNTAYWEEQGAYINTDEITDSVDSKDFYNGNLIPRLALNSGCWDSSGGVHPDSFGYYNHGKYDLTAFRGTKIKLRLGFGTTVSNFATNCYIDLNDVYSAINVTNIPTLVVNTTGGFIEFIVPDDATTFYYSYSINDNVKRYFEIVLGGIPRVFDYSHDFSITDEAGNIILQVVDGYIVTKNFDSRKPSNPAVATDSNNDCAISDNKNNVALFINEGNIVTKEFDSRKKEVNPLLGKFINKNIAIIGDSISTYQGYIPSSYRTFYPNSTWCPDVVNVNQCYWKIVADKLKMNANNVSYSGSQVSGNSADTTGFVGCGDKRISDVGRNSFVPDIIWIYFGINDWGGVPDNPSQIAQPVPIGNWNSESNIPNEGVISTFSESYALMIWKLQVVYPKAKIFCGTLMIDNQRDADLHYPTINSAGVSLHAYNEKIREIAHILGCNIIEMPACGINYNNMSEYFGDGRLHPNAAGHIKMANHLMAGLISKF